jgi:hypothetical protein
MVALILMMLNPWADGEPPADAAAVRILLAVAAKAATQPGLSMPAHGYVYERSSLTYLGFANLRGEYMPWYGHTDRETWVAANGSGRLFEATELPNPPLWPHTGRLWHLIRVPTRTQAHIVARLYRRGSLDLHHVDGLSIANLATLANDTNALTRRILAVAGRGRLTHLRAFLIVADLLRQPASPPQLRAGLFRVLTRLHPVGVANPQVTNGQWGIAVYIDQDHIRYQLDFNAKTTVLLAEEQFVDSVPIPHFVTLTNQRVETVSYSPARVVRSTSDRSGPPICGILLGKNGRPQGFPCG